MQAHVNHIGNPAAKHTYEVTLLYGTQQSRVVVHADRPEQARRLARAPGFAVLAVKRQQ